MNAPNNSLAQVSDVLTLGGTLLGQAFNLAIPIIGKPTAFSNPAAC